MTFVKTKFIPTLLALLLAFTLALSPFMVKRAHAFAPVVVGAGAALAAEIGISEAALYAGVAALIAGATGIATYEFTRDERNGVIWPDTPGEPIGLSSWGDLTPEQKQYWVPEYGTISDEAAQRNYDQQAFQIYLKQMGLLEDVDNGGNMQPTPEPEDPDEKARWQKSRNVLALLGTGAVVGLADCVGALGEDFIDSLFEPNTNSNVTSGMGLPLKQTLNVDDKQVNFMNAGTLQPSATRIFPYDSYFVSNVGSGTTSGTYSDYYVYWVPAAETKPSIELQVRENDVVIKPYVQLQVYRPTYWVATNRWVQYNGYTSETTSANWSVTQTQNKPISYLNPYYAGGYIINGTTYTPEMINQEINNQYGQMVETPDRLAQNINNYNNLYNWANYYQNADNDNTRAVAVPTSFSVPGSPEYTDYVQPYPEEQVQVPSETEPYDPSNPNPNPNPNPDDEWDFDSNLSDALGSLSNAFTDMLFPFCLIGDIRDFAEKISTSMGFSGTRGTVITQAETKEDTRTAQQYTHITLQVSDFNVEGLSTIDFDLSPMLALGNLARPWWTVLMVAGLLSESIRYFLK